MITHEEKEFIAKYASQNFGINVHEVIDNAINEEVVKTAGVIVDSTSSQRLEAEKTVN